MSVRKPKITKWVLSPRKSGEKFMARHHRHDKVSKKIKAKFPQIYIDKDADFASIKIAPGNEASSYVRDGFVFCEDDQGQIIEIQILNLSLLKKLADVA